MEYRIVLQRMEFRALHGCYELERKVGNRFTVDLEITACLGDAAAEDSVEQRSTTSRSTKSYRSKCALPSARSSAWR